MSIIDQGKQLEFSKSIIEGVEIKRCRNTEHAYKPHVHNELSLGYIVEGSTELSLNGNTIRFVSGDGVIIPPLFTHRCAPTDISQWAYIMLYIDSNYYINEVNFDKSKKIVGSQAQKLKEFIHQLMIEEMPDTLENILIELLLEFGEQNQSEKLIANSDDAIVAIRDYIITHVSDDITLNKLEEMFALNKFTIIRHFKSKYSTTPAAYHLQHRVAEGKRMLTNGVDIFGICDALRFYDQAHFIREFKKMNGITPTAYIEQIK